MELGLLILFVYWVLVKLNGGKTKLDVAADRFAAAADESSRKTFDPFK